MDVSIIKFKGRISFIAYNLRKPIKWLLKFTLYCSLNTDYVCSILLYQRNWWDLIFRYQSEFHYQNSFVKCCWIKFLVFKDNVHGSILCKLYLGSRITQTKMQFEIILTNRKELLNLIKKPKFHKESTVAYRKDNTLVLAWKDKSIVRSLTDWNNAGITPVKRILWGGVQINVKKTQCYYKLYKII